jgi:hypothetical protein
MNQESFHVLYSADTDLFHVRTCRTQVSFALGFRGGAWRQAYSLRREGSNLPAIRFRKVAYKTRIEAIVALLRERGFDVEDLLEDASCWWMSRRRLSEKAVPTEAVGVATDTPITRKGTASQSVSLVADTEAGLPPGSSSSTPPRRIFKKRRAQ